MSGEYYDYESNKIYKDSKIQLWNNKSALDATRSGISTTSRAKYTLSDQVNFAGETATNKKVRELLNVDVHAQCLDTKNVALVIAKILKEEGSLLSTREQVNEFIPRFQNFMDSLNYVAPAYKNLSKLDCQGIAFKKIKILIKIDMSDEEF